MMPRLTVFLRRAWFLSALTSLLLFGLGAWLLGGTSEPIASEGALRVEPRVKDLGDLAPGAEVPVSFSVTNLSSKPVKLLGVPGFCVSWGCVYATGFPVRVSPRTSTTFSLHIRPNTCESADKFAFEIALCTDAPGRERTPLRITGRVVPLAER
jgi:hypothetical protein